MLPQCAHVAFGDLSQTFLPTIRNNQKKLLTLAMVENVNVGNVSQVVLMDLMQLQRAIMHFMR
jgi:hypothetical protein